MKRLPVLLLLCLIITDVAAQLPLQGQVVDNQSGAAVSYATVGLLHQGYITNADSKGLYKLMVLSSADTLLVSCVGYQEKRVPVAIVTTTPIISLEPKVQVLRPVIIQKLRQQMVLNSFSRSWDFTLVTMGLQLQVAQHLQAPREGSLLRSVQIGTGHSIFDPERSRFRIRIYDIDSLSKGPGKDLCHEAIEVQASTRNVTVDLTPYSIVVPNRDFFVAVEWLRIEENEEVVHSKGEDGKETTHRHYNPSIRMREEAEPGLECWSLLNGWSWRKQFYRKRHKAAISAVVLY
jgi:hypothetical protein